MNTPQYLDILWAEFQKRSLKNAAYSLRALARDLKISPSFASKLFNNKVKLSSAKAAQIAEHIGWNDLMRDYFLALVRLNNSRTEKSKQQAEAQVAFFQSRLGQPISENSQNSLLNWYDLALLEMTFLKTPHAVPQIRHWANRLGISEVDAAKSLVKLEKSRLIKFENGSYKKAQDVIHTTDEITSHQIQHLHQQFLDQAMQKIELPIDQRDYTALTFSFEAGKLPEFKEAIRDFRIRVSEIIESSQSQDSVYTLMTQVFPLTEAPKNL